MSVRGNLTAICELVHAHHYGRPKASAAYIAISWFLFASAIALWGSALPFFWWFRSRSPVCAARPLWLNVILVLANLIWTLTCLNLVVALPCGVLPFSVVLAISGMAVNYCIRLSLFGIESQFAKNAHLLQTRVLRCESLQSDTSNPTNSRHQVIAPYYRCIAAMLRLLLGCATVETLDITEIAGAKQCYKSLTAMAFAPGFAVLIVVLRFGHNEYFACTNCIVTNDILIGFFAITLMYAVITGRILFVLWRACYPDELGIMYELKMTWLFSGLPLLPFALFWILDIDNREHAREFAYEWLFQLDMLVLWWFVVGAQIRQVYNKAGALSMSPPPPPRKGSQTTTGATTTTFAKTSSLSFSSIAFPASPLPPSATPTSQQLHQQQYEELYSPEFEAFMVRQLAVENLYFLQDVASFKQSAAATSGGETRRRTALAANSIFTMYIKPGAAMEVNISDVMRREIIRVFHQPAAPQSSTTIDISPLHAAFDAAFGDVRKNIVLPLWAQFQVKEQRKFRQEEAAAAAAAAMNTLAQI